MPSSVGLTSNHWNRSIASRSNELKSWGLTGMDTVRPVVSPSSIGNVPICAICGVFSSPMKAVYSRRIPSCRDSTVKASVYAKGDLEPTPNPPIKSLEACLDESKYRVYMFMMALSERPGPKSLT